MTRVMKNKQNKRISGLVGSEFQDVMKGRGWNAVIYRPTWSPQGDKAKCPTFPGTTPSLSNKWQALKTWKCTSALSATCSYFCPVPGRLPGALSYSGTRMSCHYRVGGHRARSRGRFALKAIAKDGTFIRREKKRSIKEGVVFNSETLNQKILEQNPLLIS